MRRIVIFFFWLIACIAVPREESPLIVAARSGDAAEVQRLAKAGSDPNAPWGEYGWTPLMHAIHKNQIASVGALLDAGADPNRAEPGAMTPLMMAAGYGQTETVRLLMRRGADPKVADHHGETALDYALAGEADIDDFTFFRCQDATVRALIAAGAPPRASTWALRAAKFKRCESAALVR